jgi:hypothetical protein
MIGFSLDTDLGILYVRPGPPLTEDDFAQLTAAVDPWIADNGQLSAVIIEAPQFPGWDSFAAMTSHFRFVRDHHQRINKVAIVTDSAIGNIAEHFASHFVSAEIKHFTSGQLEAARQWAVS